jgi:hypothetical protein
VLRAKDWALRVSVAQIERDGPFSAFHGIDRWFAVVNGAGVRLQFGSQTHRLTQRSEPLAFDGAAPPGCELLDGMTLDINLMVRRNAGHANMQRARPEAVWRAGDEWRALYTNGQARLQIEGRFVADLAAAALVWHPYAGGAAWSFHPYRSGNVGLVVVIPAQGQTDMKTTLWRNARLATMQAGTPWGWVDHGALLVRGESLQWVGPMDALPGWLTSMTTSVTTSTCKARWSHPASSTATRTWSTAATARPNSNCG